MSEITEAMILDAFYAAVPERFANEERTAGVAAAIPLCDDDMMWLRGIRAAMSAAKPVERETYCADERCRPDKHIQGASGCFWAKPVEGDAVERVARALWELEYSGEGKWPVNVEYPEDWYDQARVAIKAFLASPQPGNDEVIARYAKTLRGYADGMERFGLLSHGYDAFSVSPVELREIADLLTKPAHQADGTGRVQPLLGECGE